MSNNNVYVYGGIFLKEELDNREPDYVYVNPVGYELKNDYAVVINEEGTQLELVDKSSGIWESKGITHDTDLIVHIENALDGMLNGKEESRVIKTIKLKEELSFRELLEYIIENDISGDFKCLDGKHGFAVNSNGEFYFDDHYYDVGETYEVEVEEEITEDTVFDTLIELYDGYRTFTHFSKSIRDVKYTRTNNIYALIDGELQLVWEVDENDR